MPWFYVDDGFTGSKPVMSIPKPLRAHAIGVWTLCGAWSAKEETDGYVPIEVVRQNGGTPRIIRALSENAQLWTDLRPDSDGILFRNWEKWQKTRAENQARRKREAEKKATWRAGRKGRNYIPASTDPEMSTGDNTVDNRNTSKNVSTGESTGESLYPDPTRPDPTLNPLVTSSGGVTSLDARGPRPQCNRHKENHPGPCPDCARRREWDEAEAKRVAADELETRRRRREARENCSRCGGTNTYEGPDGLVYKCDHEEASNA